MLSIVIITKNEAHIIGNTLQNLQEISEDIIIVDSGSTDDTIAICKKFNTTIIETKWDGYGVNKNKGIDVAKNDWILSLDADEVIDEELKKAIIQLREQKENHVFNIKRKNFFRNKLIRYGVWAGDKPTRLFNRKMIRWNDSQVHEKLVFPKNVKIITLKGYIHHYTVHSMAEYIHKTVNYAKLNANKYHSQGKQAGFLKLYFGPMFNFIQHYFFRLGFLDGWEGYIIAKTNAWYTFLKYAFLRELNSKTIHKPL